jgi:hypothetical protein
MPQGRSVIKKAVALALTALLSVGMIAAGTTAASAAGTPAITVTEIPDGGGAVTVTGTGFDPASIGIYVGAGAQGAPGFYSAGIEMGGTKWVNVGNATTATQHPMNADGSFSLTLTLPADDGTATWAVYTAKAQGGRGDTTQATITNLTYTAPVVVEPPVVVPPVVEPPVVVPPVVEPPVVEPPVVVPPVVEPPVVVPPVVATPAVTVTKIPNGGGAVTVSGTGFDTTSVGIYVGAGPQGATNFYTAGITASSTIWVNLGNATTATQAPMNADGSFSVTLTLPADNGTAKWAVYTSKAHGQGFADPKQNTISTLTYAPAPVKPTIAVGEIPNGGGAVTVTGTGFEPTAVGIYVTAAPQGYDNLYATPAAERLTTVAVNTGYTAPTATRAVLNADGSFTTTITFPADDGAKKWAIYTSIARNGGITDPSQNTTTNLVYTPPVVVVPPVVVDPVVTTPVTVAEGTGKLGYTYTSVAGGLVTVTGSGFSPTSPGIYVGLAQRGYSDFYAAAGTLYQGDAVNVAFGNADATTGAGRTAPMNADGTFSITLAVPASDTVGVSLAAAAVGAIDSTWAIYTSKAHGQGMTDTSQNAILNFAYQLDVSSAQVPVIGTPIVTTPGVTVPAEVVAAVPAEETAAAAETCVARSVSGATLNWAIKDSFRTYIKGGIANGTWELSSIGDSNGQFVWSNGTGTINTAATRGTVSFPGTMRFTGHEGALDITITDVKLRFSGSAATLTASFDSLALDGTRTTQSNVAFANVAAGSVTTTGSRVSLTNAATTLTSAGATAFGDFYDAGAALAPLSLTAPLGATVPCTESTYSSLASTGTDTLGGGMLLAALLVMVGFGGISLARRRRAITPAESSMI